MRKKHLLRVPKAAASQSHWARIPVRKERCRVCISLFTTTQQRGGVRPCTPTLKLQEGRSVKAKGPLPLQGVGKTVVCLSHSDSYERFFSLDSGASQVSVAPPTGPTPFLNEGLRALHSLLFSFPHEMGQCHWQLHYFNIQKGKLFAIWKKKYSFFFVH
jgi:hypothetical protein